MPQPLRIGLIGQQFMGKAHSNGWGQVNRFFDLPRPVRLELVAARDKSSLNAFAERWGWSRTTTRWQDLVVDEDVDLVDVGTPNDVHAEPALAALAAGKHVACEKPLAGTLADARAMRNAARRARGKTFVWFNYRRCPAIALAWQLVREGHLGTLYHVRAKYLQSWGGPETPLVWRFQRRRAGSGAHGDLNAHIVDLARFLTGDEIREVHGAVARTFIDERIKPEFAGEGAIGGGQSGRAARGRRTGRSDVDDCVLFLASFKGGAVASFEATRLATGHLNRNVIELNGSDGALRWDFEDMNVLWLHEGGPGDRTSGWRRVVATAPEHPWMSAWWPDAHVLGYEHGFVNMAADIVRATARHRPVVPLPDFADAYETQRVLEAALIAAKERVAVPLSQVR